WTHDDGPEAFRGLDMNISLNHRLSTHWWLQASAYRSTGEQRSPFQIDPLAPPDQFFPIPRERSFFLSIRYERQAGTQAMVLGGPPGSATGSIRGSVFLDENGDGIRSASELPAVNVTVVLDGRYVVRTVHKILVCIFNSSKGRNFTINFFQQIQHGEVAPCQYRNMVVIESRIWCRAGNFSTTFCQLFD